MKALKRFGILILAFALAVTGAFSACKKKEPVDPVAEQLSLGDKYLDELDYEQALACYMAAIEIDEKNIDAYIGAAKAFIKLKKYERAIRIIDKGYEITESERLAKRHEKIIEEYEEYIEEYLTEIGENKEEIIEDELMEAEEEVVSKEEEIVHDLLEDEKPGELPHENQTGDTMTNSALDMSDYDKLGDLLVEYYNQLHGTDEYEVINSLDLIVSGNTMETALRSLGYGDRNLPNKYVATVYIDLDSGKVEVVDEWGAEWDSWNIKDYAAGRR